LNSPTNLIHRPLIVSGIGYAFRGEGGRLAYKSDDLILRGNELGNLHRDHLPVGYTGRQYCRPHLFYEPNKRLKDVLGRPFCTAPPLGQRSLAKISRFIARAPASLHLQVAWGNSMPTRFAGLASQTGRTRRSSKATQA
jgi:hypothetical protein